MKTKRIAMETVLEMHVRMKKWQPIVVILGYSIL